MDQDLFLGLLDKHVVDARIRVTVQGVSYVVGARAREQAHETHDVAIRVHRIRFFRRVLCYGNLGLGEAYMDGDFEVGQETLVDFLTVLLRNRLDQRVKQDPRLALQLSATYWWHKHVVVHHPAPNVIGIDRDIDFSPWFVLTKPEVEHSVGGRRLYYKLQWLIVPLAIAANGFNVQAYSWWHVIRMLCKPHKRKRAHWIDLGMLLLHWVLWVGMPIAFFPVMDVLALYVVRFGLLGYAFLCVRAPAHFPAEAVCVEKSQRHADLLLRQTATTVNFRTGYIGRFLCSGLDYQIEHHLFPGVSHVFYPKMSGLVKEFCRRQGYPYRTLGWSKAIWKSCLVFRRPKTVEPCLEAFRLRPQRF